MPGIVQIRQSPSSLTGLWGLFFLLCLGLGYSAVKRYDVRTVGGMSDTARYHAIVEGQTEELAPIWLHRALLPVAARPVYWLLKGRTGSWDPVQTSLLVCNAALVALAAQFVYLMGLRTDRPQSALPGALLYLLNFQVTNYLLAGMVDSLQAATFAVLPYFLAQGRWKLVFLAAIAGAAGKETTLVLVTAFTGAWVLKRGQYYGRFAVMTAAAAAGTQVVPLLIGGTPSNFLALAEGQQYYTGRGIVESLWGCIKPWNLWFTVGWTLPFAWTERRGIAGDWASGCLTSAIAILALGTWSDAGPNIARPLFNVCGPLLCLATAQYLVGRYGGESGFDPQQKFC
jgi:hypothetical protein